MGRRKKSFYWGIQYFDLIEWFSGPRKRRELVVSYFLQTGLPHGELFPQPDDPTQKIFSFPWYRIRIQNLPEGCDKV